MLENHVFIKCLVPLYKSTGNFQEPGNDLFGRPGQSGAVLPERLDTQTISYEYLTRWICCNQAHICTDDYSKILAKYCCQH
jgi:hypothetical protein